MNRKTDNEEALDMATYEPLNSEFREHALMGWRTENKGIKMYGLQWKYMLLTMEDEEQESR